MQINIKYAGFTEIKIIKTGDSIEVTAPFLLAGNLEKIPADKEFTFSLGSFLKGLGELLSKVKSTKEVDKNASSK